MGIKHVRFAAAFPPSLAPANRSPPNKTSESSTGSIAPCQLTLWGACCLGSGGDPYGAADLIELLDNGGPARKRGSGRYYARS